MKFFLSILTLAVLAALCNSASVLNGSRANLNVGSVRPGDMLLQRRQITQRAISNAVQYQDYAFSGNSSTNITAVNATENGRTQYANASIIAGGIGRNNVTIRLQSARGYGFDYIIEIYGR